VRDDGHAVRAWLLRHRVPATAIFGGHADATLPQIRSALAFRERLRGFASGDDAGAALRRFRAFDAGRAATGPPASEGRTP
jgi:hypothetical protein